MKTWVTKYDEDLLAKSKELVKGAEENPTSRELLGRYEFSEAELERGRKLIANVEKSFEWERSGRAYNFLSTTPEKRVAEAKHWYADTRRRWVREAFRHAEEDSGWVGFRPASQWPLERKLTEGTRIAVKHAVRAFSVSAFLEHRANLKRDLALALQDKPADAPPPKDTALVELAGWYERWRMLVQRVFRQRPDLMAPFGLTPGKAPPRLRGKAAQQKYGERAAGSLPVLQTNGCETHAVDEADDDDDATADASAN